MQEYILKYSTALKIVITGKLVKTWKLEPGAILGSVGALGINSQGAPPISVYHYYVINNLT